jgi:hypothetical protein
MGKTVTISDDLAVLVEARRKEAGYVSLDATAEALIAQGLIADDLTDDHSDGRSEEKLRDLIDDAETSGPETPWDGAAVKAEVLRRYAARGK